MEHLRLALRGRHSTWSTFIEVGRSLGTSDAFSLRLVLRGRRSTWSISGSFCVAGAPLGASPVRFAWQAQHLEHLRFVLRGRRNTWSISGLFCVAGAALRAPQVRFVWQAQTWSTIIEVGASLATIDAFGRHLLLPGRRSLGASPFRLAWQAQHLEHLHRGRQKSGDE